MVSLSSILSLGNHVYSIGGGTRQLSQKNQKLKDRILSAQASELERRGKTTAGKNPTVGLLNYKSQKFNRIDDALGGKQILYAPGMRDGDKETELRHCMIYYGYGNKRDESKNVDVVSSMVFPLPEAIQDETTLEWAAETDKVAKAASRNERVFSGPAGFVGAFTNKIGDWWSETQAGFTGTGGRREKGVAFNSHEEYFFKGVGFRDFSFKHKLIPISPSEAADVKTLVDTFKYLSSPSYSEKGKYFTYPSEFEIHFLTLQEGRMVTNEHLTRIGRCVLDKVSVNYTSEGSFQSLPGGEPIVTELELSFKELDLVTKETLSAANMTGGLNHSDHAGSFVNQG